MRSEAYLAAFATIPASAAGVAAAAIAAVRADAAIAGLCAFDDATLAAVSAVWTGVVLTVFAICVRNAALAASNAAVVVVVQGTCAGAVYRLGVRRSGSVFGVGGCLGEERRQSESR